MVFYLVAVLIIIFSFMDFKKSFLFYMAFKLFLVQDITLISIPGIPLLTVEMFMNIFYSLLYLAKRTTGKRSKVSFPFLTPMLLVCVSWLISSFFSAAGIGAEISAFIGNVLNEIVIVLIAWNVIETKEDFDFLFRLVTVIIFVSCIYGFIEYTLQYNPLSTYEATLNHDPSRTLNYSYGTAGARGYHVKSIFEHAIGASMIWALYCAFVLMSVISYGRKLKFQLLAITTAILCIPLIMLTKQRSGMVFLIILSLTFIKPKKARTYFLLIPLVIGIAAFYDVIVDNIQILLSIFSSSHQSAVSGSSISLRMEQLGAALKIMLRSPIWGLGIKYRNVLSDYTISLLRGAESIWFTVIPCYGMIGIVVYAFYVTWSIYRIPKFFKSTNLFWLMLAYWFVYSASSVPGFKTYLLYLVACFIIKNTSKYKNMPSVRINEWSLKGYRVRYRKIFSGVRKVRNNG